MEERRWCLYGECGMQGLGAPVSGQRGTQVTLEARKARVLSCHRRPVAVRQELLAECARTPFRRQRVAIK